MGEIFGSARTDLRESRVDLVHMLHVFRELPGFLRRCGCGKAVEIALRGSLVAAQLRGIRGKQEPEEMLRLLGEYRVCLRTRDSLLAGYGSNTAKVVSLIGVQRAEHEIRLHRHWREELHTILLSSLRERHDTIVKPACALLGTHLTDVRRGTPSALGCGYRGISAGESRDGGRRRSREVLAGHESNERNKRDRCHCPGESASKAAVTRSFGVAGASGCGRSAAMTELRARSEIGMTAGATRASERGTTVRAELARGWRATRRTDCGRSRGRGRGGGATHAPNNSDRVAPPPPGYVECLPEGSEIC